MVTIFLAATALAALFLLHCAVVGAAALCGLRGIGRRMAAIFSVNRSLERSALPAMVRERGGEEGSGEAASSADACGRGRGIEEGTGRGSAALALFFSICLGMLVNMAGLFALGLAGRLHLAAVGTLALVLLLAGLAVWAFGPRIAGPGGSATAQTRVQAEAWPAGRASLRAQRGVQADAQAGRRGAIARDGVSAAAGGWASRSGAAWLQWAVLGVIFLLAVAVSLHPPGHWDDTMYQLPLARHYVEQQAIALQEYLRFPLFPQNLNLLFALGIMVGDALPAGFGGVWSDAAAYTDAASATAGATATASASTGAQAALWRFGAPEVFAQVFATLPLFVMALGLWGASQRYLGSGIPGLLAGLSLFMIGPVKSTLGFAYIDNGLALFCWATALAVAVMAEPVAGSIRPHSPDGGLLWSPMTSNACTAARANAQAVRSHEDWPFLVLLAGLMAGAACGTKYFGVVFAAWAGVVIAALMLFRHRLITVAAAALYTLGILLAGSAWYIRSYLISGDPAHPAGAPVFGFFLWNEGDLAFQYAEQAVHGVGGNPLMLPAALLEAGVLLWLPAFAGLFLKRVPPPVRALQALFIGYMLFWFFVSQVPRYLGPAYGLGGFLAFHALYRAGRWAMLRWQTGIRPFKRRASSAGGVAALVLVLAIAYAADRGVKYAGEYRRAEQVLATHSGYALYQQANAHSQRYGARLAQVGFEDGIYFFRGTVIGDWFGPGRYRDILECGEPPCPLPPPASLAVTLRRHGARMLLLNRQQVVDLDESALRAAGWRVLAQNEKGVLLAAPAG